VIKTFANKETAALFADERVRSLPHDIRQAARRKLAQVHHVGNLEALRVPPGNRLERLSGDRSNQWSIRINNQWRICFKFEDGNAFEVEVVDYH